jgi:hypothetical protein
MRKCLLIIIATFQRSFSQDDTGKRVQHDFESLKLVLPKLSGNDRVDCSNALASKACDLGRGGLPGDVRRATVDVSRSRKEFLMQKLQPSKL